MSATEAASRPRELINSDRMLLAVLSMLLLSHAGLYYVCLRFNLPFAFAFAWSAASFVLDLQLPESIASAIIENFFMLVVGESYAFILTIRFMSFKLGSRQACSRVRFCWWGTISEEPTLWTIASIKSDFSSTGPRTSRWLKAVKAGLTPRSFVGERVASLTHQSNIIW